MQMSKRQEVKSHTRNRAEGLVSLTLLIITLARAIAEFGFAGMKNVWLIWISVALAGGGTLLLVMFVSLLKREPAKLTHLKQQLQAVYLDSLAKSFRESDVTSKA